MELSVLLALVVVAVVAVVGMLGQTSHRTFAQLRHPWDTANGQTAMEPVQPSYISPTTTQVKDTLVWPRVDPLLLLTLASAVAWIGRRHPLPLPAPAQAVSPSSQTPSAAFVAKRQRILHSFSGDLESFLTDHLCVGHLMTTTLTTVSPQTPDTRLRELMAERELRHLLVVDRDGRLLGIVSDRDLKQSHSRTAQQLMTTGPLCCTPDTSLRTAVTMLLDHHVSSLPVIDGDRLVGIFTTSDVAMALQCALLLIEKVASNLSKDPYIASALLATVDPKARRRPADLSSTAATNRPPVSLAEAFRA